MIDKLNIFIRRKVRHTFRNWLSQSDRKEMGDKKFVIVSNNCWGGEVYQWYGRPYNTPFVGLFIYGPCYHKLLSNFDHYMSQKLEFIEMSKSKYAETGPFPELKPGQVYPVGKLDDIEIHFLHYESEEIASSKWERRTARMLKETDKDNYFFKTCDKWGNDEYFEEFHGLPYKNKISFSIKNYDELKGANHIQIKQKDKNGDYVVNGRKLFKLTFLYFNLLKWLKNGQFIKY